MASQTRALASLQHSLAKEPGVAGVIGPATVSSLLSGCRRCRAAAQLGVPNPMLAKSGSAARYGVILATDPLGAYGHRRRAGTPAPAAWPDTGGRGDRRAGRGRW